jgi:hypothetical protein
MELQAIPYKGPSLEAVAVGPEGMRSVMNAEIARYRDLNKRLKISMD